MGPIKTTTFPPVDPAALAQQLKDYLMSPKPSTKVLVTPEQLNEISGLLGAGHVRDGAELIELIKARTSLFFPNLEVAVQLVPEDLSALKDQFLGTGYTDFEHYVKDTIVNAIAMYLHGSIRVFEAI